MVVVVVKTEGRHGGPSEGVFMLRDSKACLWSGGLDGGRKERQAHNGWERGPLYSHRSKDLWEVGEEDPRLGCPRQVQGWKANFTGTAASEWIENGAQKRKWSRSIITFLFSPNPERLGSWGCVLLCLIGLDLEGRLRRKQAMCPATDLRGLFSDRPLCPDSATFLQLWGPSHRWWW